MEDFPSFDSSQFFKRFKDVPIPIYASQTDPKNGSQLIFIIFNNEERYPSILQSSSACKTLKAGKLVQIAPGSLVITENNVLLYFYSSGHIIYHLNYKGANKEVEDDKVKDLFVKHAKYLMKRLKYPTQYCPYYREKCLDWLKSPEFLLLARSIYSYEFDVIPNLPTKYEVIFSTQTEKSVQYFSKIFVNLKNLCFEKLEPNLAEEPLYNLKTLCRALNTNFFRELVLQQIANAGVLLQKFLDNDKFWLEKLLYQQVGINSVDLMLQHKMHFEKFLLAMTKIYEKRTYQDFNVAHTPLVYISLHFLYGTGFKIHESYSIQEKQILAYFWRLLLYIWKCACTLTVENWLDIFSAYCNLNWLQGDQFEHKEVLNIFRSVLIFDTKNLIFNLVHYFKREDHIAFAELQKHTKQLLTNNRLVAQPIIWQSYIETKNIENLRNSDGVNFSETLSLLLERENQDDVIDESDFFDQPEEEEIVEGESEVD